MFFYKSIFFSNLEIALCNWKNTVKGLKEKRKIELCVRLERVIRWQYTQCLNQEKLYQSETLIPQCKETSTSG